MKITLAASLITISSIAVVGSAFANPQSRSQIDPDYFCFLRNRQGQVVNLTSMCISSTPKAVTTTSRFEQNPPSSDKSGTEEKELSLYTGPDAVDGRLVQSYLQYEGASAANGTYQVWLRREFPNAEQRPNVVSSTKSYVEVVCGDTSRFPFKVMVGSNSLRTTKSTRFDFRKIQTSSATGQAVRIDEKHEIGAGEASAIVGYLCSLPRQVSSEPGRCDYPWQKDAKGRYCSSRSKYAMSR